MSIIGLGASGFAAALLAANRGAEVYVSEIRTDAETRTRRDRLESHGVAVELGRHDVERIVASALVVVSPGVPPDAPVLLELEARGGGWISEPELAVRCLSSSLIAVTGTNGKTTTTVLTTHLLQASGKDAVFGGNVGPSLGPPATELALRDPAPEWAVIEMSSFQLADIETFRPDIGVVTNLAPDHLDRYESVDAYFAAKARIFDTATSASRWVLNGDDPAVLALAKTAKGTRYLFSLEHEPDVGGFVRDGVLVLRVAGKEEPLIKVDQLSLLGRPGQANALAAALAARLAGVEVEALASGLRSFAALPDRLEPLGEEGGVLWVNDSKATNVTAAVAAISSLDRRSVVLLGGQDKGEDFAPLVAALNANARAAVLYGAALSRIRSALESVAVPVREAGSFEEAVKTGRRMAESGDALLLAPACSSFDMFRDYRERGDRFRALGMEAGLPVRRSGEVN